MVNYKKKYLKYKLKYQNLLGGTNLGKKKLIAFLVAHHPSLVQYPADNYTHGQKLTNFEYLMKLIEEQLPQEFYKISEFFDIEAINSMEINDNRHILKQLAIDFHLLHDWFNETTQPLSITFLREISTPDTELNFITLINLLNTDNLPSFIVMYEEDVYPDLYEAMYEAYGNTAALEEELEELQELQKNNLIAFSEEKRTELNQKYGL